MTRNRDTDYNNNNINNNNDNNHYNKFERKISKLFDDFLNTHGSKFRGDVSKNSNWSPAIDIKEVDREYLVIADVPGVRKDDIDIEFHDSVLVLTGHLNQDLFSTPQAQEINIGNRQQYPQHQHYQQPPQAFQQSTEPPRQHQQPLQESQPYQQTTEPQKYHQQPTEAQQYQQAVDQKYNLTNEPQQQSNHPPQQNLNNPNYQQQSNNPQYQQQSNDPNHQQQSNEYQHIKNRRHQDSSRGERFHIQERPYGHFSRSIQLPSNIKSDEEFYATLENGVLKISIPKNNDKPRRKITIK